MVNNTNSNGTSWQQSRLSVETEYADAPVVLRIGGVQIGTLGNFSASIGKAKSKKSFNVSAMAAAALCGDYVLAYTVSLPPDRPVVLYIDTEQSLVDCQRLMLPDRVRTQTVPTSSFLPCGSTHRRSVYG